ncbi:YtxH domain-containing protein [Lactiplantibacillus plantarum]|uniref:YtxH domain-containing protein n=1 Tax=Lactiplantibacillus plantarum TaxID=1590 RepID=UPI0028693C00|nr:YtxH domain-containing protein [Lactiplantibacillus plantarum]WMX72100.1 YtxH domain-containing protein [Lactiplantibacillus plantarum]
MAKFIRNSLIGLGLSAATYMLINQKTPKALYTDIKNYVQDVLDAADNLQDAREEFSDAQSNLSVQMAHAAEVFDDIQTELDKFQFKIEPHVAIMKKRADHLQDTLDHLTKTTD